MVVMQDASAEMQGYEWKDDCKDDYIDYCINETDLDLSSPSPGLKRLG
jgi:hypothetical protein